MGGWNRLQTLSRLGAGGRGGGCLHDAVWRAAERAQVDAVLHIVLFQLGQDVFSIRVLPQGGNVGPDLCRHKQTSTGCMQTGSQCLSLAGLTVLPGTKQQLGAQEKPTI